MPLHFAVVRLSLSTPELVYLKHHAAQSHLSLQNFVRSRLGLGALRMGRPTPDTIADAEDADWALLRSIGIDPAPYFRAESQDKPSRDYDEPSASAARLAQLQAITRRHRENAEASQSADPARGSTETEPGA